MRNMKTETKIKLGSGATIISLLLVMFVCGLLAITAGGQTNMIPVDQYTQAIREATERADLLKLLLGVLGLAVASIVYLVRQLSQLQRETNATITRFITSLNSRPCIYTKPPMSDVIELPKD
jgi:hypothetical protein